MFNTNKTRKQLNVFNEPVLNSQACDIVGNVYLVVIIIATIYRAYFMLKTVLSILNVLWNLILTKFL